LRRNRIKIIAHKVLQIIVETNLFLTTRVDIGISALKKYIKKNNFIESPSFKLVVYFSKSKTEEKYYE